MAPNLASVATPLNAGSILAGPSDELGQLAEAVRLLAEVSRSQSEAMLALARSTAESVQLAAGSYVFQLRDRFDELLPATNVGASDSQWTVPDSPGPLEQLIFHPGDPAFIHVRVALSQAPIKRIVSLAWTDLRDGVVVVSGPRFAGSGFHRSDTRYQLDADISLFVDYTLSINIGDRTPGEVAETARITLECTDIRPEGAVGSVAVAIHIRALVVPDDDGVGLDLAAVDAVVLEERRTYWLDKGENLPLQLPRLH